MYYINHFYTSIDGLEMVLMMPHTIWTEALLIYKESVVLNVCNLSDPSDWYAEDRFDSIAHDLARIHLLLPFEICLYMESHVVRSDLGKIGRRGEEIPCFL